MKKRTKNRKTRSRKPHYIILTIAAILLSVLGVMMMNSQKTENVLSMLYNRDSKVTGTSFFVLTPKIGSCSQESYSAGSCDVNYRNTCEDFGCNDCSCLSKCVKQCSAQGKYVNYCTDNACVCTGANACV